MEAKTNIRKVVFSRSDGKIFTASVQDCYNGKELETSIVVSCPRESDGKHVTVIYKSNGMSWAILELARFLGIEIVKEDKE